MNNPFIAIVKHELWTRRWSILWWIVGLGVFIVLILGVYPVFRGQSAQLDQSLQNLPSAAKSLFTDTGSFLSPIGYLSSQLYYLLLPLLFSFLAIGLGSSLIAREESSSTIELILALPVSRTKLYVSKASAGLIELAIVGLVTAIISAVGVAAIKFDGVATLSIIWVTLMSLALATLFGVIAFALTAFSKFGRGAAIGVAALVGLGGYIISSLDQTVTWLIWPARFLPFHYYHPAQILGGNFTLSEFIGFIIIILIIAIIGWAGFRHRDLTLG